MKVILDNDSMAEAWYSIKNRLVMGASRRFIKSMGWMVYSE